MHTKSRTEVESEFLVQSLRLLLSSILLGGRFRRLFVLIPFFFFFSQTLHTTAVFRDPAAAVGSGARFRSDGESVPKYCVFKTIFLKKKKKTKKKQTNVFHPTLTQPSFTQLSKQFGIGETVLALYPQTTCFYQAVVHMQPSRVSF